VATTEQGGVKGVLNIPLEGTVFYGPDEIGLAGIGRLSTVVVMNENATKVMVHLNPDSLGTEKGGVLGIGSVTGTS
jgi:hypothetical protein